LFAVLFVVGSTLLGAGGAVADGGPPWCQVDANGRVDVSRLPAVVLRSQCDLTGLVIGAGTLGLVPPPAGMTAVVEATGEPGFVGGQLSVTTLPSGDWTAESEPLTLLGANGSATSSAACSDTTQGAATAYKVKSTLNYGIRTSTIPANVGSANGVSAIQSALTNMRTGANDCGLTGGPNALNMNYTGATATVSNINADGTCATLDASHVVEWGALPANDLALTCWIYDGTGALTHYDMRFNSANTYDWTLTDGCYSATAYDIAAVATHEWGHVYGISHVTESTHGNLTMSTVINGPCQTSERTLGAGDFNHMKAKYP
jgi:hypothetical protein